MGVRAFRNKPHDVGPDVTRHLSNKAGDGGNGGHDAWCPIFDRGAHYAVLTNVFAICAAISRNITGTASQQGHASYETCANQPFVMKLHWGAPNCDVRTLNNDTPNECWQYDGMTNYQKFYINGKWVAASSKDTIQVFDSTDESVMATIPAGTAADVDAAAKAAHAALDACAALDVQ